MSTRKGQLEEVNKPISTEVNKSSFKIDTRREKVFFEGEWIDPKEDEETLYEILESKKDEIDRLKNSFLKEFQKTSINDDKTRDAAKKIGELSTYIKELENLLSK